MGTLERRLIQVAFASISTLSLYGGRDRDVTPNQLTMNTILKTTILSVGAIMVIALFASFMPQFAQATLPNYHSRVASTATTTVGPQTDKVLFYERELCATRIITTYAQPVSISFFASSTFNVSPTEGHLQGASTTVAYDAELYGCGQVVAAAGASTTITIAEFAF